MRVLLDAAHAADVWVLGALEERLRADGADTLWISRPGKEAVAELLTAAHRPTVPGPPAGHMSVSRLVELARRDLRTWRTVRSYRPDVIVTRSPAGVHAGRLCHTPVVYDTDDGTVAGLLYRVAGPLADVVTSPAAIDGPLGRDHRTYRGYKELAYLGPDRFNPDPTIRASLGLASSDRFVLLRLTAFTGTHDRAAVGLAPAAVERVRATLAAAGPSWQLRVSTEGPVPSELAPLAVDVDPHRFHDVVAAADLVVSDGQTVCSEAAVLGVPALRCNSWVGRHAYQVELEHRWGLLRSFGAERVDELLDAVREVLGAPDAARARHRRARQRMLRWAEDPVAVLEAVVRELGRGEPVRRRPPTAAA